LRVRTLGERLPFREVGGMGKIFSRTRNPSWSPCPSAEIGSGVSIAGKNCGEFKVYYRDDLTRSMVYLGTVIERRRKERGNNLGTF